LTSANAKGTARLRARRFADVESRSLAYAETVKIWEIADKELERVAESALTENRACDHDKAF
jgi:hypothetical protein